MKLYEDAKYGSKYVAVKLSEKSTIRRQWRLEHRQMVDQGIFRLEHENVHVDIIILFYKREDSFFEE